MLQKINGGATLVLITGSCAHKPQMHSADITTCTPNRVTQSQAPPTNLCSAFYLSHTFFSPFAPLAGFFTLSLYHIKSICFNHQRTNLFEEFFMWKTSFTVNPFHMTNRSLHKIYKRLSPLYHTRNLRLKMTIDKKCTHSPTHWQS